MWSDRNIRDDRYRYSGKDRDVPMAGRDRVEYGRDRSDWGSARSDYGRYAYGGRLNEQGAERYGRRREDRGLLERTGDEVRSWFCDEEAERRRRMDERQESGNDSQRSVVKMPGKNQPQRHGDTMSRSRVLPGSPTIHTASLRALGKRKQRMRWKSVFALSGVKAISHNSPRLKVLSQQKKL